MYVGGDFLFLYMAPAQHLVAVEGLEKVSKRAL